MFSYTITIGRGALGTSDELSAPRWAEFKESVRAIWYPLVTDDAAVEDHEGMGRWAGKAEMSYKTTLLTEHALEFNQLDHIKAELAIQRDLYGQDAIAFTLGLSMLV